MPSSWSINHPTLQFAAKFPVRRYDKGELILVEGEVPSCCHIIKSGVIKGYSITSEGLERPVSFDVMSEVFPIGWVFHRLRSSQYFYEAFTDAEVYCIPRDVYLNFLKSTPDALFAMHDYFVGAYMFSQMRLNALEQSKAADKIINMFHYLALRFGRDIQPNVVEIILPLSQQELANVVGLTRETTGLELKKLRKQGILQKNKGKHYVVNTEKLDAVLDVDYEFGRLDIDRDGRRHL